MLAADLAVNRSIQAQLQIGPGNALPTIRDPQFIAISRRKVYTINRAVGRGTVTLNGTLPFLSALSFRLSDLPMMSDFTALFDQYRFQQVRVKFVPAAGPSNTNAFHLPPLYTVIDYDDDNVPGSVDVLRQYGSLQVVPPAMPIVRTLSPRLAVNVFGSGVFGSFSQARLWCDSGSPGVAWYGLKFGLEPSGVSDTVYYIECEYIVNFRSTF
jgi:hypothetical protein